MYFLIGSSALHKNTGFDFSIFDFSVIAEKCCYVIIELLKAYPTISIWVYNLKWMFEMIYFG
jgi:hypothetical protein